MSNIPILTAQGRSDAEIEAIVNVLAGLHTARQIAYDWTLKVKGLALDAHYTRCENHYRDFCAEHELTPDSVFNEGEHIAKRIAERDPDFILAYPAENQRYLDTLPNRGMRVARRPAPVEHAPGCQAGAFPNMDNPACSCGEDARWEREING